MYSNTQQYVINTLDEMRYTPPALQFNNDTTDPYDCFICPGGEKPDRETFMQIYNSQPLKELRQERNRRLAEVDWMFSGDYKIDPEIYQEWLVYRKALRDLPSTIEDPANPTWPEKPAKDTGRTVDYYERDTQSTKIILLQNVVNSLLKRIENLENP